MNQKAVVLDEVRRLGDVELVAGLRRLVRADQALTARLLVHLGEVDSRGLYREHAFESMFSYAVEELHMSEAEAYLRIHAARVGREFPLVLQMFANGELHLTAIKLLGSHLTHSNHVHVLALVARTNDQREPRLHLQTQPHVGSSIEPCDHGLFQLKTPSPSTSSTTPLSPGPIPSYVYGRAIHASHARALETFAPSSGAERRCRNHLGTSGELAARAHDETAIRADKEKGEVAGDQVGQTTDPAGSKFSELISTNDSIELASDATSRRSKEERSARDQFKYAAVQLQIAVRKHKSGDALDRAVDPRGVQCPEGRCAHVQLGYVADQFQLAVGRNRFSDLLDCAVDPSELLRRANRRACDRFERSTGADELALPAARRDPRSVRARWRTVHICQP
jgi:hypothetical protein